MKHFRFHSCQKVEMQFYKGRLAGKEVPQMLEILKMKLIHLCLYLLHPREDILIPEIIQYVLRLRLR